MKQKLSVWKKFGSMGLLSLVVTISCASPPKGNEGGEPLESQGKAPPKWLSHIPGGKAELCATGISGPTYYPEDAVINSKAQAITELSRSIESKVKAGLTVTTRGGGTGSSQDVDDSLSVSTEEVVRLSQVRAQWVNPGGYSQWGGKGTVYTLVCMPLPGAS